MLDITLGIIATIVVFTIIVFFHELGHFSLAKLFRTRVDEFGIGIPPRAVRLWTDRSGTEYTLNWLPIGGFVRIHGETGDPSIRDDQTALVNKPLWQQLAVVLAGVFMNFVFAIVVLSILFMSGVSPLGVNTKFDTAIQSRLIPTFDQAVQRGIIETDGISMEPLTGSIAERAGIQKEDILVAIDGQPAKTPDETVKKIHSIQTTSHFTVRRAGQTLDIPVTPEGGRIGSYVGYHVNAFQRDYAYQYGPIEAIRAGTEETYNISAVTLELLRSLVVRVIAPQTPAERSEAVASLSGPIGIGDTFVELIRHHVGLKVILTLAAIISINLGIVNVLPFPALDGARALFMIVNACIVKVFRKNILGGVVEGYIHMAGFSLLIALSVFVAYHDVARLLFP